MICPHDRMRCIVSNGKLKFAQLPVIIRAPHSVPRACVNETFAVRSFNFSSVPCKYELAIRVLHYLLLLIIAVISEISFDLWIRSFHYIDEMLVPSKPSKYLIFLLKWFSFVWETEVNSISDSVGFIQKSILIYRVNINIFNKNSYIRTIVSWM